VKQQELAEREDVLWVQSEHRRALDIQVKEHQQRLEWEKRLQTMEWQAQVILCRIVGGFVMPGHSFYQVQAEQAYTEKLQTDLSKPHVPKYHGVQKSQWFT
jgi:hypothetical protein